MQVEISISIPPDRSVTKFKMDSRKVLALLDIIECVVDKRKDRIQQRLDELEKELSSEYQRKEAMYILFLYSFCPSFPY